MNQPIQLKTDQVPIHSYQSQTKPFPEENFPRVAETLWSFGLQDLLITLPVCLGELKSDRSGQKERPDLIFQLGAHS